MSYYDIVIYTDGSCLSNGLPRARAGYGVYCPDDQRLNFARRLDGRQSSQRAEIMGARCGILRAEQFGYEKVLVRTDSNYVIKGILKWLPRWENPNYTSHVENLQDFRALRNSMIDMDVDFEKISRYENEEADGLARQGAMYAIGQGKNIILDDS